jgi:hypothetical protein
LLCPFLRRIAEGTVQSLTLNSEHSLSKTGLVAVLSRRLREHWARTYGLSTREFPFAASAISTQMRWHRRFDDQAAHLWLRTFVERTAEGR